MPFFPEILWAQRSDPSVEEKNVIYLTVNVTDLDDPQVTLTSTSFDFKGSDGENDYAIKINFFKEIDTSKSKKLSTGRSLFYVLQKKDIEEEYWPRLTKEKVKHPYIKTDFDRWVDQDEQDDAETNEPDNLEGLSGGMPDMSGMGGMPGMGGMGGMPGMPDMGGMDFSKLQGMDTNALLQSLQGGGLGGEGGFPDLGGLGAGAEGEGEGEDEGEGEAEAESKAPAETLNDEVEEVQKAESTK